MRKPDVIKIKAKEIREYIEENETAKTKGIYIPEEKIGIVQDLKYDYIFPVDFNFTIYPYTWRIKTPYIEIKKKGSFQVSKKETKAEEKLKRRVG